MCKSDPNQIEFLLRSTEILPRPELLPKASGVGSRRRRLWEMEERTHCPVVGVCLPIAALRRLAERVLGGRPIADDYELHSGAVTECAKRTRMSGALQRELDRRYQLSVQHAGKLKSTEELSAWWREASAGKDARRAA